MVNLFSYLFKQGVLTYSLVLPQEGSQRKSSEAIAEEIAAKSPTRSRRQEAEGLAQKNSLHHLKFHFTLLKSPSIIFFRTTMNQESRIKKRSLS